MARAVCSKTDLTFMEHSALVVGVNTKGGASGFKVTVDTLVGSTRLEEFLGSAAFWLQMLGWCFLLQEEVSGIFLTHVLSQGN